MEEEDNICKIEALLDTLYYDVMSLSVDEYLPKIINCLERFLTVEEEDVREKAYTVLVKLPKKVASPLIKKALAFEQKQEEDSGIIEGLLDLLGDAGFKTVISLSEED